MIVGFALVGVAAWFGMGRYQNYQTEQVIETIQPTFSASIEKVLSSTGAPPFNVGAEEFIRCVRVTLESKISGVRHTGYFIVNVTHKVASQIDETIAASCVTKAAGS